MRNIVIIKTGSETKIEFLSMIRNKNKLHLIVNKVS